MAAEQGTETHMAKRKTESRGRGGGATRPPMPIGGGRKHVPASHPGSRANDADRKGFLAPYCWLL